MTNPNEAPTTTYSFPESVLHSMELTDGRTLSYRTFLCADSYSSSSEEEKESTTSTTKRHPVLYFHGFPGSSLQGSVCAQQVHEVGGELFAIDRPGFGYSDPYPPQLLQEGMEDAQLACFCDNVWELIDHLKWTSFSILGLSGGGPFTLAMLKSYLDRRSRQSTACASNMATTTTTAKLEAIAIVAGIYAPAGIQDDDMMDEIQTVYRMVNSKRTWTLRAVTFLQSALIQLLPASLMLKMMPTSQLPPADQELLMDNNHPAVTNLFYNVSVDAMRQGSSATLTEAMILFRKDNTHVETSLKAHYRDDDDDDDDALLPRVSIFQGSKDVNVPPSHSAHVYHQVLHHNNKRPTQTKLHIYEDLGHASLIVTKGLDYARSVMPTNVSTM